MQLKIATLKFQATAGIAQNMKMTHLQRQMWLLFQHNRQPQHHLLTPIRKHALAIQAAVTDVVVIVIVSVAVVRIPVVKKTHVVMTSVQIQNALFFIYLFY